MTSAFMAGSPRAWRVRARVACAALAVVSAGAAWSPAGASARSHPHTAPGQSPIQSGLAFAWGDGASGELGQGNDKNSPVPLSIARLGGPVAAISAGTDGSLALSRRGRVWAWGGNDQGQLGIGSQQSHNTPVMVRGPGGHGHLSRMTAISSSNVASAGVNADGQVFTWGDNIWGQLGAGTVDGPAHCPTYQAEPPGPRDVCSKLPVPVVGPSGRGTLSHVVAIAGTTDNTIALRSNGTVWTWGINVSGQLGIGTNSGPQECKPYSRYAAVGCSTKPVQVVGPGGKGVLTHVVAIAGGAGFEVALRADGTVWAWGSDAFADLGQAKPGPERCYNPFADERLPCSTVPVQVSGPKGTGRLTDVVAISAEPSAYGLHVLALRSNGTVWSWGINVYGQLGNGKSQEFANLPGEVVGPKGQGYLRTVVSIAAGGGFSMARLANGSIWTWGENNAGQLGIGNDTGPDQCTTEQTACSLVPVQVKGPHGAGTFSRGVEISAGQLHATALQTP
jgi:alpha-tubulin suppressor-like RCC1 family protein